MKKVMIVARREGEEQFVHFYDNVEDAVSDADIIMTSLGGYAEVYERQVPSEENDFDNTYTCVYCG